MSKKNTQSAPKDVEMKQVDVKSADLFSANSPDKKEEPVKKLPDARNLEEHSLSEDDFDNKYKKKGKKGEKKPLITKQQSLAKDQEDANAAAPQNPKLDKKEPKNPYGSKYEQPPQYTPTPQG